MSANSMVQPGPALFSMVQLVQHGPALTMVTSAILFRKRMCSNSNVTLWCRLSSELLPTRSLLECWNALDCLSVCRSTSLVKYAELLRIGNIFWVHIYFIDQPVVTHLFHFTPQIRQVATSSPVFLLTTWWWCERGERRGATEPSGVRSTCLSVLRPCSCCPYIQVTVTRITSDNVHANSVSLSLSSWPLWC